MFAYRSEESYQTWIEEDIENLLFALKISRPNLPAGSANLQVHDESQHEIKQELY